MATEVHWTLVLHNVGDPEDAGNPVTLRLWDGLGDLSFAGQTYQGTTGPNGAAAAISGVESNQSGANNRATASLIVPPAAIREILAFDAGPVRVDLRYIYRTTPGGNWLYMPVRLQGRLSAPRYVNGIYSVEIETYGGDNPRNDPVMWSDESQQLNYPGDTGFRFLNKISSGFEAKWPPR